MDITSKSGKHLFGAAPPAVGAGSRVDSGIDMVFFLYFMGLEGDKVRKVYELVH